MNRLSCRTLVVALALPLLGVGLGSGCSRQSEGEPCDADGIDQQDGRSDDCETGLICTAADNLHNGNISDQDRCCPPIGSIITDDRCTPGGGSGTGGAGGTGSNDAGEDAEGDGASGTAGESGSGGTGGTGGTDDAAGEACAAPCRFNSQCAESLVCGPLGCCQPECLEDRDCTSPELCVAGKCELVVPDAGVD